MSITFEEVTGEIQPERRARSDEGERPPPPPAGGDDLAERLQRELRLMAERQARLSDA